MRNKVMALAGAVSVCAVCLSSVAAAETDMTVSMWLPPSHPVTKYGYADWLKNIEETSKGSLKPKLYTGSVLLAPADHLSGIRDGIAHFGWIAGTYNPSDIPEDNTIFQMSFIYSDYFVGSFAVTEFNMLDEQMQEQWRRNNLVYMSGFSTPPYRLICTSEIDSLETIKGKKIRSTGGALPEWVKSVGAVPVNVASSESYTGLEKGQLDCATNAMDDLRSRSYWDVAKDVTLVELGAYWSINAGNRTYWQKLNTDQRTVLLDTVAEGLVDTGIGYMSDVQDIINEAKEKGVTLHEPKPGLAKSVEEHKAKAREFAISLGSDKFKVKDVPALVARFEKVAMKWETLLKDVDRTDRAALLSLLKREVYDRVDPSTYGMK
ncbi:MAG: C4-dicarboxylate TRAP transporter substrate-binding protein [Rhodospirillales bacterium]|nr:C4-dicarboxylate TRAP transporter substrate-binding protein [Rhodospirillales bacterium]